MARVPYVAEAALPADLRPLYHRFAHEYGNFGNQAGVLGHSPVVFRHLYGLTAAMREDGALPPRLVEIAVVATSAVNGCKYCVGHHGPVLRNMGFRPRRSIASWRPMSRGWTRWSAWSATTRNS
jgi:AhpD family alkylhydroperoxidase